ncbi:MAG: hypothetical protein LAO78_09345 [Acidobacteriia bacterium]|nr:hypothetical protein [Terriglobia bacterium]
MADAKPPKPSLFRYVHNTDASNCFPFMTENPIEAAHYFARGFHDAADNLIVGMRVGHGFPDYAAPPIVFLYRHAAELYLKSVIWNGDEILAFLQKPLSGGKATATSSHSLTKLIPYAEFVVKAFGLKWNEAERGQFDDSTAFIRELDAADPNSYSFRYPVDTQGKASQHTTFGFNLFVFAEQISKALEGWWNLGLDVESVREYHMLG